MPYAAVRLINEGNRGLTAVADQNGRYEFVEVPAGAYRIQAGRPPYLRQEYGQKRSFERGVLVQVRDGQTLEKMDLALRRGAAISGRVFDENGDPLQDVPVVLFRVVQANFGRKQLEILDNVAARPTDDAGRFRRYAVPPGQYLVATSVSGDLSSLPRQSVPTMPGYAVSFAPGTSDAAQARVVTVTESQEVTNVNVTLVRARTARLSGTVLDSTGRGGRGTVSLESSRRAGGFALPSRNTTMAPDGRFQIANVAAGEYVLKVFGPRPNAQTVPEFLARYITMNGDDVDVQLQTSAGSTLSGRVTCEGSQAAPNMTSVRLVTTVADTDRAADALGPSQATVRNDGTFEFRGLNGPRRIQLAEAPSPWMLKAVHANGTDLTDRAIEFGTSQQSLADVEIVLTPRASGVSGSATDATGRAATDYAVVAYATNAELWYPQTRFVRFVRPNTAGAFAISGLPPGQYYVAAVEWLQGNDTSGEWQDSEFLDSLSARATRVSLSEGQQLPVTLRIVTRPF
jgi:hypothetical protein